MLPDARFNFASNSHRISLKLNESQQLEREILRNYNLELSTFMAPIVKTLPSYIKDSQHALEIVRDFNFLGQDKLLFTVDITSLYSVICHSVAQKFFDPRTVKKPISETTPLSQTSANNSFQLKLSNIVPIPLPLYLL